MVTAHAANIDLPGGDAMVPDTAYESYSYNSVDMDLWRLNLDVAQVLW